MASISQTSKPLQQATTADLAALKAYSLAIEASLDSRFDDAWDLYEEAIRRDPEFSMAYLRMAFLRYRENDGDGLDHYLSLALKYRSHLSEREALFLDAAALVPEGPGPTMRRLKVLSAMYPDEYRAYYNFAYFGLNGGQRYRESMEQLDQAISVQNPQRGSASYLQGALHAALGQHKEAIAAFERSQSMGVRGQLRQFAEAYAAQRRFEDAGRILAMSDAGGLRAGAFEDRLPAISFAIDQGRWEEGVAEARRQAAEAPEASELNAWVSEGLVLALRGYVPDPGYKEDLAAYLKAQASRLEGASRFERRHLVFHVLAAGWMAAGQGWSDLAHQALDVVEPYPELQAFPANADMARMVRAELLLRDDDPEAALAALEHPSELSENLYLVHAIRMRAHQARGDLAAALAEAEWLRGNRGLAYMEFNSLNMLQPMNLVEANLALRQAADLAKGLGKDDIAKARLAEFEQAWPAHATMAVVARRFPND